MKVQVEARFCSYRSEPDWRQGVWRQWHKATAEINLPFAPPEGLSVGNKDNPAVLENIHWNGESFTADSPGRSDFNYMLLTRTWGDYDTIIKEIGEEIQDKSYHNCQQRLLDTGLSWTFEPTEPEESLDVKNWALGFLEHIRRREERELARKNPPPPPTIEVDAAPKPWWKFWLHRVDRPLTDGDR